MSNVNNTISNLVTKVSEELETLKTRENSKSMKEMMTMTEEKTVNLNGVEKMTKAKIIEVLAEQTINANYWQEKAKELESLIQERDLELNTLQEQLAFYRAEWEETNQKNEELKKKIAELEARPMKTLNKLQEQLWQMVSGRTPIHELWYEVQVNMSKDGSTISIKFDTDFYKSNKDICYKFLAYTKTKMMSFGCSAEWGANALFITKPSGEEPKQSISPMPTDEPLI